MSSTAALPQYTLSRAQGTRYSSSDTIVGHNDNGQQNECQAIANSDLNRSATCEVGHGKYRNIYQVETMWGGFKELSKEQNILRQGNEHLRGGATSPPLPTLMFGNQVT